MSISTDSVRTESNRVLVLDTNRVPLMPCHPARARQLLMDKKAAVYRRYPFTIILRDHVGGGVQHIDIKIDPGTKYTGMALVALFDRGPRCIYGLHIKHRGVVVRQSMAQRAASRRTRRSRALRYRPARFSNRTRPLGWVPPSIESRVSNVTTWVRRLLGVTPADKVYFEVTKFDTTALSKISDDQYSTDARIRTQMRHYLLHIHSGVCQYCRGATRDRYMEWEHIIPRSKGGTNALSNATLSCRSCNYAKGTLLITEWLMQLRDRKDPVSIARCAGILRVMTVARRSIRDASIMNWTRYIIVDRIRDLGIEVVECPAWETAYHRHVGQYVKTHWVDAACIGYVPYLDDQSTIYTAVASGYGTRQMVASDRSGFPRGRPKGPSRVHGYRTGDMCRLNQLGGKYKGVYVGRITIRTSGRFDIRYLKSKINSKYTNYVLLHSNDGYMYTTGTGILFITIN